MINQKQVCDVTELSKGDIVHYYNAGENGFCIDKGLVKEENLYIDGVEVVGEDWKQYVSKYFICKVERDGEIIFELP